MKGAAEISNKAVGVSSLPQYVILCSDTFG